MAAYVLKSWMASPVPRDEQGVYVRIVGRAEGLLSWMLALLGIDPVISLTVLGSKLLYEEGSLSGSVKRVIPLRNVSSSYYGYLRPWKRAGALGFFIFLAYIVFSVAFTQPGVFDIVVGALLGTSVAILHYYLNKTLTIGIVEVSGVTSIVRFKRSVIEGKRIDEAEARVVCNIIESLLDKGAMGQADAGPYASPQPALTEEVSRCSNCGKSGPKEIKGQYCAQCGGRME